MPEEGVYRHYSRGRESSLFDDDTLKSTRSRSPPSTGSRSSPRCSMPGKLAQDIHDEFLVCKICLDAYRNPKSLSCLHTFCEECIENHIQGEVTYKKYSDYRDFTCPLCRKRTQLPLGGVKKLPDNFLVSSLSEMVSRQKPAGSGGGDGTTNCEICSMVTPKRQREACSKCVECGKVLCKSCVDQHRETKVTKDHAIFDIQKEKEVLCREHADEVVRYYCEECHLCICVLCTFNQHRDHDVTSFSDAVSKYRDQMSALVDKCKSQIDRFATQVKQVAATDEAIKEAEKQIHDLAIKFIADIRQREKQLIDEIHNIYGKDVMSLVNRKSDLESEVESIRTTCSLTEVVLHGQDIEFLLLRSEVEAKLDRLSSTAMQDLLPKNVGKKIRFLEGKMDLGCVQEMDSAASGGRLRRPVSYNDGIQYTAPTRCAETQTQHSDVSSSKFQNSYYNSNHEGSPPNQSQLPALYDVMCQTYPPPNQIEVSTTTEPGPTLVDKAINTRTRSLHHQSTVSSESGSTDDRVRTRRRRVRPTPADDDSTASLPPAETAGVTLSDIVTQSSYSPSAGSATTSVDGVMPVINCTGDDELDDDMELVISVDSVEIQDSGSPAAQMCSPAGYYDSANPGGYHNRYAHEEIELG